MSTRAELYEARKAARRQAASLPGNPFDGSGGRDGTCEAIVKARDDYGHVLWLFGDSIFRGRALNIFPDEMSEADIAAEPLHPLRSPASMINLITADQGASELDVHGIAIGGRLVACYAGLVGQPFRINGALTRINKLFGDGHIRKGDMIAYLDAGLHTADPDLYEAQWVELRRASARDGVKLLMCTAFDNLAGDKRVSLGGEPRENFMYEIPFRGEASGVSRTHNDAVKAAAAAQGLPGETVLIDMAAIIRDFQTEARRDFAVDVYHRDNIHLNVWGQLRLACVLFRAAWPDRHLRPLKQIKGLLADNWPRLGYQTLSPTWSAKRAVQLMKLCRARG